MGLGFPVIAFLSRPCRYHACELAAVVTGNACMAAWAAERLCAVTPQDNDSSFVCGSEFVPGTKETKKKGSSLCSVIHV